MKRYVLLLCITMFTLLFGSCKKSFDESSGLDDITFSKITMLNDNINHLQELAFRYSKGDEVLACEGGDKDAGVIRVFFADGKSLQISQLKELKDKAFPVVSLVMNEGAFFWTLNDRVLTDSQGRPIDALTSNTIPVLSYKDGSWFCQIGSSEQLINDSDVYRSTISIEHSSSDAFLVFTLSSGSKMVFAKADAFFKLKSQIPNNSYYKNVFLNAGVGLGNFTGLPAVSYLGLSMEGINLSSDSQIELQNAVFGGEPMDLNGRLLYPDGQPRYQMMFIVGGSSKSHARSLTENSRENMRKFYLKGGSYVGVCGGSSFVSKGFDRPNVYPNYLHIWPEFIKYTRLSNVYTGFSLAPDSPLLDYYDFGGDLYIANIIHSGGHYSDVQPEGGEILTRFDYPANDTIHQKPSSWAYKESPNTGRIVQCGSHPERYSSGEVRDFMASCILYAIDGRGTTPLKGILQNGIRRHMVKSTTDNDPDYTMIGDLQYHHFAVYIPSKATEIKFALRSDADVDLSLRLNKDEFAYDYNALYTVNSGGANHDMALRKIEPGLWYVSVKCNTTVTATVTDWGYEYSGRTDVLNGVPYSIMVEWTIPPIKVEQMEPTERSM